MAGRDLRIHSGPMAGPMVLATGGSGRTNLTRAFGAGPGLVVIGAAYLGVGMQAGPAVSAVLLYQLATYRRPGWLRRRSLPRQGYM